ncbi:MAG TPA: tetratricopeptide repeat protein [Pirellulaceae bacterium]|nr:tetratricopeptide repeat protein [Pirellulaceae bacterium]
MVRRTLNLKVLIATIVALAALGGSLLGLHAWQVTRTAGFFLVRATAEEKESNWLKAAGYIDRYLSIRPKDNAARVRLALDFGKGAETFAQKSRAIDLCFRAVVAGAADQEADVRLRLCELLLESGRFIEADRESRVLLAKGGKTEAPAARVHAMALWAQWKDGSLASFDLQKLKIVQRIAEARLLNPTDVDLAIIEAEMYRKHSRLPMAQDEMLTQKVCDERADDSLEKLIAASPDDAKAYLARHLYRVEYKLAGADSDLAEALELAPKMPEVLLVAGSHAYRQGAAEREQAAATNDAAKPFFQQAKGHYQEAVKVLDKDPRLFMAYLALGESCIALDQIDEAIGHWREGAKQAVQPTAQAHLLGRVADTLLATDRTSEADAVLLELEEIVNRIGAGVRGSELVALNRGQNLRRALYQIKTGRGSEALGFLRSVIGSLESGDANPETSSIAYRLLGDVSAAAGQWLEAADAYDRAATFKPADYATRMATANAWLMAGRPALAADQVERVLKDSPTVSAWLLLATAEFRRQAPLSPEEQSWSRFEQAMAALGKRPSEPPFPGTWRIALLQADYEVLRGKQSGQEPQAIAKVADDLRKAEPELLASPDCPLQWILFYEHVGLSADADRALASLDSLNVPPATIAVVGARLAAKRRDYQRAADLLDTALRSAPAEQQRTLRAEAAQIAAAGQDYARAETILKLELKLRPQDTEILRQLAELELARGNAAGLPAWEEKLAAAGPWGEPLLHLFRGYRLVLTASANDQAQLQAALEAQSRATVLRPQWGEAYVLRGMIEKRQGRMEPAIRSYQQAIDLGVQRVAVYEELIDLLDRMNRPADCNRYLARLANTLPISQRLTQLAGNQQLRQDNPEGAVEIARQRADKQPRDPLARLWLGRVLLLANQPADAQREFERAVELAPEDARVWNGLFTFFVQTRATDQARKTLAQLAAKARLEPSQRSYILAQGHEMLGDVDEAKQYYEEAVATAPKSADIHLKMAGLYLRRDPQRAEASLRRALEIDPSSDAARRMLAIVLTSRGGAENLQQAEALLGNVKTGQNAVEDRRLQSLVLLARKDQESLQRAIQIMNEVAVEGNSPPGDRLILSQLYQRLSLLENDSEAALAHRTSAREQLLTIASGSNVEPSHLATLVDFLIQPDPIEGKPSPQRLAEAGIWLNRLEEVITHKALGDREAIERLVRLRLRHGSLDRCTPWLNRLEASGKEPLRTLTLQVDLLVAQGAGNQAEPLIEERAAAGLAQAADQQQRLRASLSLANLHTRTGNHAAAERWSRKVYEEDPSQYAALAGALARQGKLDEALTLCEEAAAREATFQPAIVMAAVLLESSPRPEHFRRIEPAVSAALKEFSSEPQLLYSISVLRILEERYDDAIELLQRTLELSPEDVRAMNNLAMVLAENPQQYAQAIRTIDKAIALAGVDAGMLDTKGAILVYDGKAQEAIPLLEKARNLDSDPRYRFHLALAYRDAGEVEKAKVEFRQAVAGDLEAQLLTPTDRRLLAGIKSLIEPQATTQAAP